jgi:integrase
MRSLIINVYPVDRSLNQQWFIKYTNPKEGLPELKRYIPMKVKSLEEREAFVEQLKKEINEEWCQVFNQTHPDLLRDLTEIVEYRCMGRKRKTKDSYNAFLNVFTDWYIQFGKSTEYAKLGLRYLGWLNANGRNNTTHNNHKRQLKSFFDDMMKAYKEKYPSNPFEDARRLPEVRQTKKWFKPVHQQWLKSEISKRDKELWLACQIEYYCFIRPKEISDLKIENIKFETSEFSIHSTSSKNCKQEIVPIPPELLRQLEYLKEYPEHYFIFSKSGSPGLEQLSRDALSLRHKKYTDWLGLGDGYTFYSWKNTGAVALVKNGVHMKIISMLMRHSSIDITDEYLKSLQIDDLLKQQMITYTPL